MQVATIPRHSSITSLLIYQHFRPHYARNTVFKELFTSLLFRYVNPALFWQLFIYLVSLLFFSLKKMFYQIELQMPLPIEKWFSRRYKSLESIGVQVHMQRYNTFVNRMWRRISVQCISYRFEWCQICTFVVVNFNFLEVKSTFIFFFYTFAFIITISKKKIG